MDPAAGSTAAEAPAPISEIATSDAAADRPEIESLVEETPPDSGLFSISSRDVRPAHRRGFQLRRALVVSDSLTLIGLVAFVAIAGDTAEIRGDTDSAILWGLLTLVWVPLGIALRLYHVVGRGAAAATMDELGRIVTVATAWAWCGLLVDTRFASEGAQLRHALALWILVIPAVSLTRALVRRWARGRSWYRQRTLLVGARADTASVRSRIERHTEWGIDIVTEIDPAGERLGSLAQHLAAEAEACEASRVILAGDTGGPAERTALVRAMTGAGLQVDFIASDSEVFRSTAEFHHLEGLPIVSMPPLAIPQSLVVAKRAFDLAATVPALILWLPLLAVAVAAIKLDSRGPVFYRQTRIGRNGEPFEVLKLRTMVSGADAMRAELEEARMHRESGAGIFKVARDPRVTRVGRILRRFSLDEAPQLFNVVKGEMSLVGPRPLPPDEDRMIEGHLAARRWVRPGLTGAWQVMGRSDIPFEDMLHLDYAYVVQWSMAEDIRILLRTVTAILRGRGAY